MIRFINEHRDRFGVELICRVLRPAVQGFLTSRGYRAAVGRAPSARQLRDDLLVPEVARLYSRRIVGWNVASTLRSEILPMQALDMAAWTAGGDLTGLIHHADHGSNYTAMVYTERIVELGAVPSTGTVGDSFDNAMTEAVNNLYTIEPIRQRGPWRTVEQVELATLEWVWWWNNSRLHGELDMRTPIEVEQAYYADLESAQTGTCRTRLPIGTKIRPIHTSCSSSSILA
ncbi:hypothetical protein QE374_002638 [Microbacterium sp. SORGH_AS428]|nr:hypothetical protein [Microbacterium sp. SORGH_AS_0428]